jgi:hypothetical protein
MPIPNCQSRYRKYVGFIFDCGDRSIALPQRKISLATLVNIWPGKYPDAGFRLARGGRKIFGVRIYFLRLRLAPR